MTDEVKTAIETAATSAEDAAKAVGKSLWQRLEDQVKLHHVVLTAFLIGLLAGSVLGYLFPH
jgi:ABC-type molybdate transport system permease subunit